MATSENLLTNAIRFEEEYNCPDCGSTEMFSPTYKQRKCTGCGHRGSESEFRTSRECDCPDCGNTAPKTHESPAGDVFTCRSCYNQFRD